MKRVEGFRVGGTMRRSVLLGAVTAVALALVVPAHATPPQRQSIAATQLDSMSCAGFDANIARNFTGRETAFFDQQGNVVRVQVEADMRGSVTNSVTGKTIALRGHIFIDINPTIGSATWVGPAFEAGPHDVIDTNGAVFCTAVG